MTPEIDYKNINKNSWNKRTAFHINSDFYNMEGFLKGETSLKPIELELLGDIRGKSLLHLQCHFGQDSISLSRLGADVTGIDFSETAIEEAKKIAGLTDSSAGFICSDIYELKQNLDKKFDIVFTSYGTIEWLPDLEKWAEIVSSFLKPGGKFVFVEFHPVVWMFDDDFEKIGHSYFNREAICETVQGTYAEKNADVTLENSCWNHSLSEIMGNLLKKGLRITSFEEFDYSPYDCFNKTAEFEPGKYRIPGLDNKIPMLFAIEAVKSESLMF